MESSDVENALRVAERSFEQPPDAVEAGLDVDDAEWSSDQHLELRCGHRLVV